MINFNATIPILIVCIVCAILCLRPRKEDKSIPSIFEFQQTLVDNGYDIKVDGRLGPETEKAWNEMWTHQKFQNFTK